MMSYERLGSVFTIRLLISVVMSASASAAYISPVMRVKLMASFGGILVMMLEARLQVVRGVSRIRWKMASGTCTSWQEERSEKRQVS